MSRTVNKQTGQVIVTEGRDARNEWLGEEATKEPTNRARPDEGGWPTIVKVSTFVTFMIVWIDTGLTLGIGWGGETGGASDR